MPGPYLIDVDAVEELEPALAKAMDYPDELMSAARSLCDDLHSFRDGASSKRVVDAVEDFIAHKKAGLKGKPLNLLRKLKVRRRLRREMRL
jgi:hypothetical protein